MCFTKKFKKLVTALCLFAVVGMFAACSNGSGSGSGSGNESGSSDEVKNDINYDIVWVNSHSGELTGAEFLSVAERIHLEKGTDYKVDNNKKRITLTNTGLAKLENSGISSGGGDSGIRVTYRGTYNGNLDLEAEFVGHEEEETFMGIQKSYSASGTFTVKTCGIGVPMKTVAEGTFNDANPEEDCSLPVQISMEQNLETNEETNYNPPLSANIVIENRSFTYKGITFTRN